MPVTKYGDPGYWLKDNKRFRAWCKRRIYKFARKLQEKATDAEKVIWNRIKNDPTLAPVWFQKPLGLRYIMDFYLPRFSLVVEVDGDIHLDAKHVKKDTERDEIMRQHGKSVLRFTNEQALFETDATVERIKSRARSLLILKAKRRTT